MAITPVTPAPTTLSEWTQQRVALRQRLWAVLGELPPRELPQPTVLSQSVRDGCAIEHFVYDNGAGAQVYGYFARPVGISTPLPTVLYLHVHGNKYEQGKEEIFRERVPNQTPAFALTQRGYAVMAIDAYCFGERYRDGTAPDESGHAVEHALYKHFVWQGSSLWGMMVRDDLMALDYLVSRPDVDTTRIGITGMSLGGTRATWLAALDDRPKVVIPVAQMTRWRALADTGLYNGHGIYYYLPAVLREAFDMEHLVALVAPRLQTILIGDQDPLSPLHGIEQIANFAEKIYALYGASQSLETVIERGIAHAYTPTMFEAMLNTLDKGLKMELEA